ncbi:hypothetical protein OEZ85_005141 [Tetradesmus obliquus]|uniref:Uncharacterized protein n=1 Tax=Tetradesmus obliquus TaxID=3088 RepID=A0ABY8UMF0_TETOB|nr:hypothetical protein OEZ85_005141 [Tetradesmus obliquus]
MTFSQPQFVPAFGANQMGLPSLQQQQQMGSAGPLLFSQRQPLPKQLTAAIKSCTSLERLSQLFAAHQAVLNPIHIAAMITKLPKLDTSSTHNPAAAAGNEPAWNLGAGQLQLRQLLQQLLLRLKAQGCGEYSPRGVANIVWALAKLQCAPDPDLRCMLLDKFCSQLPTAVPQDISNVLWGVAKITKERAAAGGSTAAVLQPLGAGSSAEPLPLSAAGSAAAAFDSAAGDESHASVDKEEAAARQLTHNIANADSVYQLAEIFSAHSSVMDMIHITACITRMSKVLGTSLSAASQAAAASLLPLLGGKLLQVLPNANARGIANVLWGYGRLRNLPQSELLPELLKAFLQQLPTAACRDSAVVLWSLARLTEGQGMLGVGVAPDLLLQLGRQVLDQLAAAAAAAMEPQGSQPPPAAATAQQQQQQSAGDGAVGKHEQREHAAEASAPPSSRDISNSLMALARLGFVPEEAPTAAAAAAAAADKSTAAAAAQPAPPQSPAAAAAAAAADQQAAAMQGLSLQADAAQPAAQPEQEAAAASQAADQQQQQQQQPPQPKPWSKPLALPIAPIKVVVQFMLRHAAAAKTLDLQEAATALKQLGLQELSSQVAATICSPSVPGGPPGQHAGGGGYEPGTHHHGMAGCPAKALKSSSGGGRAAGSAAAARHAWYLAWTAAA